MESLEVLIEKLNYLKTTRASLAEGSQKFQISKEILTLEKEIKHFHQGSGNTSIFPKELTLQMPRLKKDKIIGRIKELTDLRTQLFEKQQVVLMNGMGGIGKTTLAQVYLDTNYKDYQHIAWISKSSDSNKVTDDFIQATGLIDQLKIDPAGKDTNQLFTAIILQMKAMKEVADKPCLLVLDNATEDLANYADQLPAWHILITSRKKIAHFENIDLDFLEEGEAILLFKKHYTREKLEDPFIANLVKGIEYHTLTIEILAKTAQELRTAPEDLQNAFKTNLETDINIPHSKEKIERVTTYLCSIFEVGQLSDEECWLLKQFACLPAQEHSYDLLFELIILKSAQKTAFNKALNSLSKKGWLLESKDSYRLHRIIKEVVIKSLEIVEQDVLTLLLKIETKLRIDQTKGNPIDNFVWVPFGNCIANQFSNSETPEMAIFFNNLALVLQDFGNYRQAKVLLEKAMNSTEKNLGENNPKTAINYSNLATVLQDLGDYQGAKVLLEKAMRSDEKNYGDQHPKTAVKYSNLAVVLNILGEYQEAKVLSEKALWSAEKHFDEYHPTIALRQSGLATVLRKLSEYQEAKILLEKASRSNEKNFGEHHPNTAVCYSNLAMVLQDLGDYKRAKVLLEKTMRSDKNNFGEHHPKTATSYSNLALVLKNLEDSKGAKILLEKAMNSNEKNFGKHHPNTAVSYSNLALVLQDLGDYHGAKLFSEKAMISNKKHFGAKHPTTAVSYSNLATVLKDMGDFKEAIPLSKQCYEIMKNHFKNPNHQYVQTAKQNLDIITSLLNKNQ